MIDIAMTARMLKLLEKHELADERLILRKNRSKRT